MDMSPSRTAAIEFDNPTPSRRRMSNRHPTDFDGYGAKRESVIILDEVWKLLIGGEGSMILYFQFDPFAFFKLEISYVLV